MAAQTSIVIVGKTKAEYDILNPTEQSNYSVSLTNLSQSAYANALW